MTEVRVAVRDLVSFCHRSGDIDHRFGPSPTAEEGIAGHQRVYERRPESWHREHPVEYRHEGDSLALLLRGRADGYDASRGIVEEIKTCRVRASSIPEAVTRMHLAQGRIYAAMIALRDDLPRLEVQLTWYNIDSGAEETLSQAYEQEELADFLLASLQRFSGWLAALARLREERDASLASLAFPPGEFRAGQREIAELVYKCVDQGGQLMVEAPTGIGKTAAVLYPALKALATTKHEAVVFVTAKTVGRRAAQDTLAGFAEAGMRARSLALTAKERICFSPGKACHADDCVFASGYYDRLPQALDAALAVPGLHREAIENIAREYSVCPYQLAMDLLPWVDVVIADQHYVYGLAGSLGGQLSQDERRWSVLLDEAHNLPERAIGMYSATLAKADLMAARKSLGGPVLTALNRVNRLLLGLQGEDWDEREYTARPALPPTLLDGLQKLVAAVGEQQVEQPAFLHRNPDLLDFYYSVLQFIRVAENWGDEYRFMLSRGRGKQSLVLRLNCLDPSRLLAQRQDRLHSVTAFSATLSPVEWARGRLGLGSLAVYSRQQSPFEPGQLQVELATHIDTRYRAREASLPELADLVRRWLAGASGNSIVYFPSYQYLRAALELIADDLQGRSLWVQEPELSDLARDELLAMFGRSRNLVAFCILGGIFGEGIDLPGEQLSSVVVVGVGLPQVNRNTELLRQWYQSRYGAGFEYAYLYPGMLKVDQALGRVIRRSGDRGRALLIDSRYRSQEYRSLLPQAWHYRVLDASEEEP